MKRNWLIFTALLLITSMACNVMGSKDSANPQDSQAPAQETTESKSELSAEDEQAAIAKDEQAAVVEAEQASTAVEQEQKPETSGTEGESVSEKDSTESDLEKISSYRSQQTWQAEFADGVVEQVIIEEEIIREPNAYHMTTQVNKVDSVEVWEFIRLGETQWTRFDSDWMKSQIEQIDFQDSMSYYFYIDYATYLESAAFSREGEETVNGIKTRRYRATTFKQLN